jgi:hypothetical protein
LPSHPSILIALVNMQMSFVFQHSHERFIYSEIDA